jgi:hypothetical protein
VPHIPLHRLQQVGDEICPSFELDINATPTLFNHIPKPDELVVNSDEKNGQ